MSQIEELKNIFEDALKNYKGKQASLLSVETFSERLKEELSSDFSAWIDPKMTGVVDLGPIERVDVEIDSQGDAYSCLFTSSGSPVSDGFAVCIGEWDYDNVYTYRGERKVIDYGNARLLRLQYRSSCSVTGAAPAVREFMENMGGFFEKTLYKWPGTFDIYKWFGSVAPGELDSDHLTSVRHCISYKIAEIACVMSETLIKSKLFEDLPKGEDFVMKVRNRTAGMPPVFYPF